MKRPLSFPKPCIMIKPYAVVRICDCVVIVVGTYVVSGGWRWLMPADNMLHNSDFAIAFQLKTMFQVELCDKQDTF